MTVLLNMSFVIFDALVSLLCLKTGIVELPYLTRMFLEQILQMLKYCDDGDHVSTSERYKEETPETVLRQIEELLQG